MGRRRCLDFSYLIVVVYNKYGVGVVEYVFGAERRVNRTAIGEITASSTFFSFLLLFVVENSVSSIRL